MKGNSANVTFEQRSGKVKPNMAEWDQGETVYSPKSASHLKGQG